MRVAWLQSKSLENCWCGQQAVQAMLAIVSICGRMVRDVPIIQLLAWIVLHSLLEEKKNRVNAINWLSFSAGDYCDAVCYRRLIKLLLLYSIIVELIVAECCTPRHFMPLKCREYISISIRSIFSWNVCRSILLFSLLCVGGSSSSSHVMRRA